jgi:hypothetical protein
MPYTEEEKAKAKDPVKDLPTRWRDITEYRTGTLEKPSKECGYYLGIDRQVDASKAMWKWNGTGMLFAFSSEWQFTKRAEDYSWAFTVFKATAVTSAGFDIYYREPVMPQALLDELHAIIEADPFLKEKAKGLFKTVRCSQSGVICQIMKVKLSADYLFVCVS